MAAEEEGWEPGLGGGTAELEWLASELAASGDGRSVHRRRTLYHSAIAFIDDIRGRSRDPARELSDADLARYRRLLQAIRDALRQDRL